MKHTNYTEQQLQHADFVMDARCDALDLPYCPGCDQIVLSVSHCDYEGRELCDKCKSVWRLDDE